jgi:hypothetical protein
MTVHRAAQKNVIVTGMSPRTRTVSIIEMSWFFSPSAVPTTSSLILDAANRLLPAVLPTRFGMADPPPNRVDGRTELFDRYWAEQSAVDYGARTAWIGSSGAFYASMQFPDRRGTAADQGPRMGHLRIDIDLKLADADPDGVTEFLVAIAEGGPAFYACAFVLRGWTMSGLVLSQNVFTSESAYIPGGDRWLGLPPGAPWLSWYGAGYASVLADLIGPYATPTQTGLLVRAAREPLTMDEALARLPALPDELLAQRKDPRFYATTPSEPAPFIPEL